MLTKIRAAAEDYFEPSRSNQKIVRGGRADRHTHAGGERRILEQVFACDRWLGDVVCGQRRAIAELRESVAAAVRAMVEAIEGAG